MMFSSVLQAVQDSGSADLWSLAVHQPAPRDARRVLIAVASEGGVHINRNFEDADAFLLYEKSGRDTCFIGRQPCSPVSAGGDPLQRTRLLADCDLVLCASISETCRQTLSMLGVGCNLAYAGASVCDAVSDL